MKKFLTLILLCAAAQIACVHACAQQAISTNGQQARKDRQYRHPQIKLKDLLLR